MAHGAVLEENALLQVFDNAIVAIPNRPKKRLVHYLFTSGLQVFGQGLEFFENLAHYQVDFMTGEDCCRMRYQVDFMVGDWLRVGGG